MAQPSLAAALRDAGVIAELGHAKEERITNERNKSYPDKAITALLSAAASATTGSTGTGTLGGEASTTTPGQAKTAPASAAAPEPEPEPEPEPTAPLAGSSEAASTSGANPQHTGSGSSLQQLRVGCIVDIPNSPQLPLMCIGKPLHRSGPSSRVTHPLARSLTRACVLFGAKQPFAAHIDRKAAAAVLLGIEDYKAAASKGDGQPADPYRFLARQSRLRPLSALRYRGPGASRPPSTSH
jgi:hypothetical protein